MTSSIFRCFSGAVNTTVCSRCLGDFAIDTRSGSCFVVVLIRWTLYASCHVGLWRVSALAAGSNVGT